MDIFRIIEVKLRDGYIVQVYADIPWLSVKCSQCKIFVHEDKVCPRKPTIEVTKAWVPKNKLKGMKSLKRKPMVVKWT